MDEPPEPALSAEERVLRDNCRVLLRLRGEAWAAGVAEQIIRRYLQLGATERAAFFRFLADEFEPEAAAVEAAIERYLDDPGAAHRIALAEAVEAPRLALLRAINTVPVARTLADRAVGGTQMLVAMRGHLLEERAAHPADPALATVDYDLSHLLETWFTRGFLELHQIDWTTPAEVLERLIEYEAVHEIRDWDDLRRRLEADRRCYGFFHPALPHDPVIFVQVALTTGLARSIPGVLDADPPTDPTTIRPDTAIFYSISNCHPGLRGISFGSFLIKQVTEALSASVPALTTFATLSPIPGFMDWLDATKADGRVEANELEQIRRLDWVDDRDVAAELEPTLLRACARYLLFAKRDRKPRDAVARFHLRNGARLERINWLADTSTNGLHQSAGMLVNYVYPTGELLENHEAYVNDNVVVASDEIRALAD